MCDKWENIYKEKLKWAYSGRDKFISSLHLDEFKDLYRSENSGKTNVAVFGFSQVGKTTLILKLLGIKDDCNLHQILRGKQKQAKSVTATTMVYLRSDYLDDKFRYKEFDYPEVSLSPEELESKLAAIRKAVEIGEFSFPDVKQNSSLIIKIPHLYFEKPENKLNINIIDLPGINSSVVEEQVYVNELIKKVIPIVDLLLLVESANSLARLESIGIPEIERFSDIPEQTRLIMTYTYSNGSEEQWLKRQDIITKEGIRKRMRGPEVLGTLSNFPEEVKVYPIEFGDSWRKLNESNPDLYIQSVSANNEFIQELTEDINYSVTEHSRLLQLIKLAKAISYRRERKIAEFGERINSFYSRLSQPQNELTTLREAISSNESQIHSNQALLNPWIDVFKMNEYPWTESYSPHTLGSLLKKRKREILSELGTYLDENKPIMKNPDKIRTAANNLLNNKLDPLINQLFAKKDFWSPIFSSKKEFFRRAYDETKKALCVVLISVENYREANLNLEKKRIAAIIKSLEEEKVRWENDCVEKENTILEINETIHAITEEKNYYYEISGQDLRTSETFFCFIEVEFKKKWDKILTVINSDVPIEDKLINFLYLYLITTELEKLEGKKHYA